MNTCSLAYIPEHLHWNDKPIITDFYHDELLYRRSDIGSYHNPFAKISLVDLSFNRSGAKNEPLCSPQDVLWNIDESKSFQKYDMTVVSLRINKINLDSEYKKTFYFENESTEMQLVHEPCDCNYPHSMFVFNFQGQSVCFENYDQTLGGKRKSIKKLRKT